MEMFKRDYDRMNDIYDRMNYCPLGSGALAGTTYPLDRELTASLLDFYGPVLTDKQRVILTEYYDEDLSLAEIAENLGITRQGVRDAIKHGEAALDELEQKLGNARRHTRMQADLDRMRLLVTEIRCSNSGSFTPDPRITNDTAEMLTILHRLDTQEDADGL